jgi:hypothetical protein
MLRVVAVVLCCVIAASPAAAQQTRKPDDGSRQARPGESCLSFHTDCGQWCMANQSGAANQTTCKRQCDGYQSTCLQTGVWSTPAARAAIRGLPAK